MHQIGYLTMGFGRSWQRMCSPRKLAQAAAVSIELSEPLYTQADGEPWLQAEGRVLVEYAGPSVVLRSPRSGRRRDTSRTPYSIHKEGEAEIERVREEFARQRAALTLQAALRGHATRQRREREAVSSGEMSASGGVSSNVSNALQRALVETKRRSLM